MRWCSTLFFAMLLSLPVASAEIVYQIKASYLYNFLQFVHLVENPNQHPPTLKVCIVGEDRFGSALDALEGEYTPQGVIQMVLIDQYQTPQQTELCQVIYVVGSEQQLAERILSQTDTTKVLTIGEFPSFIQMGGFIELFIENDSVRFRINSELAGKTQFRVAAQLLSLGVGDS